MLVKINTHLSTQLQAVSEFRTASTYYLKCPVFTTTMNKIIGQAKRQESDPYKGDNSNQKNCFCKGPC